MLVILKKSKNNILLSDDYLKMFCSNEKNKELQKIDKDQKQE